MLARLHGRRRRFAAALVSAMVITVGVISLGAGDEPVGATDRGSKSRQEEFVQAAREFGVPASVLLAVSYNESRWEGHEGAPSTTGGYGPMALLDARLADLAGRGTGSPPPRVPTAQAAAELLGASPRDVETSEAVNIRAGAALLASYARRRNHGALPAGIEAWRPAVTAYGGELFAHDVYETVRMGVSRHTVDGQLLSLAAHPSVVAPSAASVGASTALAQPRPECPILLHCNYIPAAYTEIGNDPASYGNYDLADRPHNHLNVKYIVIHDTEQSYHDALATMQDPTSAVSAHYLVRGSDGLVTQLVPTEDVAWHAGNWYVNMHAVGIEQVGVAIDGATWYTEQLYRTTAALVRYAAMRYHIPLDREHILGHDEVPAPAPEYVAGMHWDPGPFWDWTHFMALVGARPTIPVPGHRTVTVVPPFAANTQSVTDCEDNSQVEPQPANFVYLRTAPSSSAPLFNDPGLNPDGSHGTRCASDWGDKAVSGQQFAVADRSGDWIAIWWDGAKVWFEDDPAHPAAVPTFGLVVTPRDGRSSIPTYGRAYPRASDYPAGIVAQPIEALPYTIKAGQRYVLAGRVPTDYYNSTLFNSTAAGQRVDVVGTDRYLQIRLGHRIAYVNADDVRVEL